MMRFDSRLRDFTCAESSPCAIKKEAAVRTLRHFRTAVRHGPKAVLEKQSFEARFTAHLVTGFPAPLMDSTPQ